MKYHTGQQIRYRTHTDGLCSIATIVSVRYGYKQDRCLLTIKSDVCKRYRTIKDSQILGLFINEAVIENVRFKMGYMDVL